MAIPIIETGSGAPLDIPKISARLVDAFAVGDDRASITYEGTRDWDAQQRLTWIDAETGTFLGTWLPEAVDSQRHTAVETKPSRWTETFSMRKDEYRDNIIVALQDYDHLAAQGRLLFSEWPTIKSWNDILAGAPIFELDEIPNDGSLLMRLIAADMKDAHNIPDAVRIFGEYRLAFNRAGTLSYLDGDLGLSAAELPPSAAWRESRAVLHPDDVDILVPYIDAENGKVSILTNPGGRSLATKRIRKTVAHRALAELEGELQRARLEAAHRRAVATLPMSPGYVPKQTVLVPGWKSRSGSDERWSILEVEHNWPETGPETTVLRLRRLP